MSTWAARMPAEDGASLAHLRAWPRLEVATVGGLLWLRGDQLDESLELELCKVSGLERYLLDDDLLVPSGCRVPTMRLPDTTWELLSTWLQPTLPRALPPTMVISKTVVRVVASTQIRVAAGLLTDLRSFHDWVVSAPQLRFQGLAFACGDDGRVLVRGTPVPPVEGTPLWIEADIAVPCGYCLDPQVPAASLLPLLAQPSTAGLHLLNEDGSREWIPEDAFVHVSRSAVRATAEARWS